MKHSRRPASPSSTLFRLVVHVAAELSDEVAAWLVEQGAGGVEEQPLARSVRLVTYGERPALARLERDVVTLLLAAGSKARTALRPAPARVQSWETEWMRHLEPVTISRTLRLVPTNAPEPGGATGTIVRLEPANAFGFGEHPTTRLAARAVEAACRAGKGSVLDVGTGSGVLAVVAVATGAARAVGTDVDARAVAAAKRNAALNDIERRCRFSTLPLGRLRGPFDLVVANIDLRTLLELAPGLVRLTSRGGALLLTGILKEHAREVEGRYRELGMDTARRRHEGGWTLLELRPRGGDGAAVPGSTRVPEASEPRRPRAPRATARRRTRKRRSR